MCPAPGSLGWAAGRHDLEVAAELSAGGVLRVGVAGGGGAPVVVRALAGPLEPSAPLEVHRCVCGGAGFIPERPGSGADRSGGSSGRE